MVDSSAALPRHRFILQARILVLCVGVAMLRFQRVSGAAVVSLSLLWIPASAIAAPIFSLGGSYSYSWGADGIGASVPTQVFNSSESSLAVPVVDIIALGRFGSLATLEIHGGIAPGELKGFVKTTADVRNNTSPLSNPSASAAGFLDIGFFDTLMVESRVLADGSPVTLEYQGVLHSTLSFVGAPDCSPGASVAFGGLIQLLLMSGRETVGKDGCGPAMPDTQFVTALIHTTVGAEVEIAGRLRIGVGAGADLNTQEYKEAIGDASNTGNFYVVPITPGVTFTSASGATYAAPAAVPEPAVLFLFATGILVTLRRRRAVPGPAKSRARDAFPRMAHQAVSGGVGVAAAPGYFVGDDE